MSRWRPNPLRDLRLCLAVLLAMVLAPLWLPASAGGVLAVDSVSIPVSDMDRAVDFYEKVLTFRKQADRELAGESYERLFGVFGLRMRAVRMALGDERIELLQFLVPRGRALPADFHSNDRWFQHVAIIVSDMDTAYARLRSFNVTHASSGPQRLPDWNPNAGGIKAFYFRDPDGNHLEILQFPPGKGQARWQDRRQLFLGIDHTAIVVGDTDASLKYYRDLLGLTVAGHSDNYGTEQEHLNNVFGAHLRITSLHPPSGMAVEFLEYLAPRTGRPIPADTQANDAWAWEINLRVAERDAAMTPEPDSTFGISAGALVRDPDGHLQLLGVSP